MPTYDYVCEACKHTFEEFQSMMDEPLKKCPKCKKKKLRRLIGTGAAIIFKGSGFYQTDYRSESYKSAAKADEPKPAASDSSSKGEGGKAESTGTTKSPDKAATSAPKESSGGESKSKKPKS